NEQDPIFTFQGRDWYQGWGMLQLGGGTSPTDPRNVPAPHVVSTAASYDGVVISWNNAAGTAIPAASLPAGFGLSAFNSDGSLSPFVLAPRVATGNRAQSIAGGVGSGTDNNTERPDLLASSSYTNGFAYFDYDVTSNLNLFVQGIYSKSELVGPNLGGLFCPASVGCQGNQGITIFANNAFLSQDLRNQMAANNIASFTMGRIGSVQDIG